MLAAENRGDPDGFTETFRAAVRVPSDIKNATLVASEMSACLQEKRSGSLGSDWKACCSMLCGDRGTQAGHARACCQQALKSDYFGLG